MPVLSLACHLWHNTPNIPSRYNNEQTTKQTKAINNSYIYISCKCDTNRAGHFTLDAYASRPVACSLLWRHNGRDSVSNHQLTFVYPIVYSDADRRRHQSSALLAFVRGIHRWPVNSSAQMASNAENVSIWWRHHVLVTYRQQILQWSWWLLNNEWTKPDFPISRFSLTFLWSQEMGDSIWQLPGTAFNDPSTNKAVILNTISL